MTIDLSQINTQPLAAGGDDEKISVSLLEWRLMHERLAELIVENKALESDIDVLKVSAKVDDVLDVEERIEAITNAKIERLRERITELEDKYDDARATTRTAKIDLEFMTNLQKLTRQEVEEKQGVIDNLNSNPETRSAREKQLLEQLGLQQCQNFDLQAKLRAANNGLDATTEELRKTLALPADTLLKHQQKYLAAVNMGERAQHRFTELPAGFEHITQNAAALPAGADAEPTANTNGAEASHHD